jgi:hypothetical protein
MKRSKGVPTVSGDAHRPQLPSGRNLRETEIPAANPRGDGTTRLNNGLELLVRGVLRPFFRREPTIVARRSFGEVILAEARIIPIPPQREGIFDNLTSKRKVIEGRRGGRR